MLDLKRGLHLLQKLLIQIKFDSQKYFENGIERRSPLLLRNPNEFKKNNI
jgi:hypothetical protein